MPQMISLADLGAMRPQYNDQSTYADLMRRRQQADQMANSARTPIYERPNLDSNAMQPDDMTFYNYLRQLGLGQERL